jgi:adenine-specific DNA methylase
VTLTEATAEAAPVFHARSFMEVQFPVSKLSKESYKERKGAQGQVLTGLGKWWGRKPLVLVRAIILGLLLPATDDPERDRHTFLALMTMDDDGLWRRAGGKLPVKDAYRLAVGREREQYFTVAGNAVAWRPEASPEERRSLQRRGFNRMSYDQKLSLCVSPEEAGGPTLDAWAAINEHLGTRATSLEDLVEELGERRWGRVPRVGDVFSGGGSIPFEAARLGCGAYGSDLNPVAALLTWGALNIVGGGREAVDRLAAAQQRVFERVQQQVEAWGIERDPETGRVADAYLYCSEVLDPTTGWRVPLAPSWVIARRAKQVIARLVPNFESRSFDFEVIEGMGEAALKEAVEEGTARDGVRSPMSRDGAWLAPSQRSTTSTAQLRGPGGLRPWTNEDLVPRVDDVYGERLYCVRWVDPATGVRHYRAPTAADLERDERVLSLLRERFADWQDEGYIPSRWIEPGEKTGEPIRTRGWAYWHHLFNPRQLLLNGLFAELIADEPEWEQRALLMMLGRMANMNSRLSGWHPGRDQGYGVFYNQALNTLNNYGCRAMDTLRTAFMGELQPLPASGSSRVALADARNVGERVDLWVTDPGYGDAIMYDELSEFFLAWYDKSLPWLFPGWYSDSKRALAVKGEGATFRTTLAECYRRLTDLMPDGGYQVVMFTHQDPEVWADLALVLWSAGLTVSAAWTIGTETEAVGIRQGNLVQGTVLLVLRKRTGSELGVMSDLYPDIRDEVDRQLASMTELDPSDDPNFGDADYQLAAYAAALRVLTGYATMQGIDVQRELSAPRTKERSSIAKLIDQAVKIASDSLMPRGMERAVWRAATPQERFYLKGIELEARGEARRGVYQELARGYGAGDFKELLASGKANATRLLAPSAFANRDVRRVGDAGFGGTMLRQLLLAIYRTAAHPDRDPRPAREYLRQTLPDYWNSRQAAMAVLKYLADTAAPLTTGTWPADVRSARQLRDSLANHTM